MKPSKNLIAFAFALSAFFILVQSFAQQTTQPSEEKAKNLKVLSKKTSHEDLIKIMRNVSKSLGVRCSYCHVVKEEGNPPKMDFATDEKENKLIARKMMKMTVAINRKYITKMGNKDFEQITCVSCHMGRTKPIVTVDSLVQKKP